MQFFWIILETRGEKSETLKRVIRALNIWPEEKDLYILSLDILNDSDFSIFFNKIMSQVHLHKNNTREYSIEPLTSQII
jgi:hypothetical protein